MSAVLSPADSELSGIKDLCVHASGTMHTVKNEYTPNNLHIKCPVTRETVHGELKALSLHVTNSYLIPSTASGPQIITGRIPEHRARSKAENHQV